MSYMLYIICINNINYILYYFSLFDMSKINCIALYDNRGMPAMLKLLQFYKNITYDKNNL